MMGGPGQPCQVWAQCPHMDGTVIIHTEQSVSGGIINHEFGKVDSV